MTRSSPEGAGSAYISAILEGRKVISYKKKGANFDLRTLSETAVENEYVKYVSWHFAHINDQFISAICFYLLFNWQQH